MRTAEIALLHAGRLIRWVVKSRASSAGIVNILRKRKITGNSKQFTDGARSEKSTIENSINSSSFPVNQQSSS